MTKRQVLLTLEEDFYNKISLSSIALGVTRAEVINMAIDFITDTYGRGNMPVRIGDVVHYHSYGTPNGEYLPEPRAAVVTQLLEDKRVGLCVLNPTGQFFNQDVPFAEIPTPGHWNFIPEEQP